MKEKKKVSKDDELNKKNQQILELTETLQRLKAEFENYQKRIEKERSNLIMNACSDTIIKILPILDNFELALSHVDEDNDFTKGMKLIYSQLIDTLEKEGLKTIKTINEKFDPYKHEALLTEESDEDNIILEELQKGYMLNDIIIRPAKVKVSKKEGKNENQEINNKG
ncbi:nucleotide exchange factor GrpE [Nanoarchaeota archaeon]